MSSVRLLPSLPLQKESANTPPQPQSPDTTTVTTSSLEKLEGTEEREGEKKMDEIIRASNKCRLFLPLPRNLLLAESLRRAN